MRRLSLVVAAALVGVVLVVAPHARQGRAQPRNPQARAAPLAMSGTRVHAIAEAQRLGLGYLPGEVVVRFRQGVTSAGQARALRALRSRPTPGALRWVGEAAVLSDPVESDPDVLVRQLRQQPEVLYAEPNYLRRTYGLPNDPSFLIRQWNLTALDMPSAWDIQPAPGRNVVVAVIDTGVTTIDDTLIMPTWTGSAVQAVPMAFAVNPDLNRNRLLSGYDFVFFAAGQPVLDLSGHGSHVASIIAQEANNGVFGTGLAYSATILPLKACLGYWDLQIMRSASGMTGFQPLSQGVCSSSAISEAIRYAADNGAHVINLSLGGPVASEMERDAILYAVSRGVFVVAAAGNAFEEGNPVEYPAGFATTIAGLVSVGAVGRTLERSFYSATGPHVELVAPGGDTRAGGSAGTVWQATLATGDIDPTTVIFPQFNRYAEEGFQGTSMAAPHVAGLAAMLMAQGVRRPADVEALITRTARDLGAAGRDPEYGFGLIQPRAALFGMGINR